MAKTVDNKEIIETSEKIEKKAKETKETISDKGSNDSDVVQEDFFNPFEGEETESYTESNVFRLGINMYRKIIESKGRRLTIFSIGLKRSIGGVEYMHEINFRPTEQFGRAYEAINLIYGDKDAMPIDIVKNDRTINNRRTITYSVQITAKDDDGIEFGFSLRPQGSTDRGNFDYLIQKLIAKGDIT